MAVAAAVFRRRRGVPSAPLGAHEVRLLDTPEARRLAEAAAILAAMDQAREALSEVHARSRRPAPDPGGADAIVEIALLRHGVVQFVDSFEAARRADLLDDATFDGPGVGPAFYRHLCAFRDELSGPHARLVGETGTVALLRRVGDRPVLAGVAIRTRRPGRLTSAELAQMLAFVGLARDACAERLEQMRAAVLDQVRSLSADELETLPAVSDP